MQHKDAAGGDFAGISVDGATASAWAERLRGVTRRRASKVAPANVTAHRRHCLKVVPPNEQQLREND